MQWLNCRHPPHAGPCPDAKPQRCHMLRAGFPASALPSSTRFAVTKNWRAAYALPSKVAYSRPSVSALTLDNGHVGCITRQIERDTHGARTLGIGTSHFPAFSFRFCFTVLLSTLALLTPSRSSKYAGTAPSGTASSLACLFVRSWCIAILVA